MKQINQLPSLYLDRVVELNDLEVEFWLAEARPSKESAKNDGLMSAYMPVKEVEEKLFKVTFDGYVVYMVFNESYERLPAEKTLFSRLFQTLATSSFLDYVTANTNVSYAENVSDGAPLHHYRINCLNHVIDVATCFEPSIEVIKPKKEFQ